MMRVLYVFLVMTLLIASPWPVTAQSPEPAGAPNQAGQTTPAPEPVVPQAEVSEPAPSGAAGSEVAASDSAAPLEERLASTTSEPAAPGAAAPEETETFKDPFAKEEGEEEEVVEIADPFYPWNKAMFHVNDKLYFWALKPVAQGYSKVVPEDFRIAISNFFENLKAPVRFVNNLLQLKFKAAGEELARFVVNSVIGVGGLGDPAKTELGLKRHDEDLGQTFGRYGVGHGFYIVWPLLGPSSARDTVGFVGDLFLTPTTYITPTADSLAVGGVNVVNRTSFRIGDYEDIIESAVDPYVSIRDGYIQHRNKEVAE